MCGIAGVFNVNGNVAERGVVERMRAALDHRGPDDSGEFFAGPIGFGFRRLSILDLEHGHQPMSTEDGRYTLVFNGEIYNHPELRAGLEKAGVRFKTRADTETVLRLFARDGAKAFERLDGMFAIAVWDAERRELTLARDPLGVKPLYYRFDGAQLAFASELRALLAGGMSAELDHAGVLDYLAYGKVHSPRTILRGALKLPAGHRLILGLEGLRIDPFWRLPRAAPDKLTLDEAAERLDAVLSESVKGAMLSDVPVGCFLSGGVDSSLIAYYMTRHSGARKVQTFSVGFDGAGCGVDESAHARQAAAHLGTEHHELLLPSTVLDRLEDSIGLLDEPIADSAILPTFFLSQFARQSCKVVLSGEGADELFAGYDRYKAAWVNARLKRLPAWGRGLAAPLARRLGKGSVFQKLPIEDAREWALATASAEPESLRGILAPEFWDASRQSDPLAWLKDFEAFDELDDALAFDLKTVMADSLLMKVDKSTMRAGLEARVPFLNRPVVEFAMSLPDSHKIRLFKGKYLLRLVASRHLPRSLAWRRKHGFIVPWESWVRSPKNASLDALLEDSALASRGLFSMDRLRLFRSELVRGSRDVEAGLFFRIAVLGLWLESLTRERLAA